MSVSKDRASLMFMGARSGLIHFSQYGSGKCLMGTADSRFSAISYPAWKGKVRECLGGKISVPALLHGYFHGVQYRLVAHLPRNSPWPHPPAVVTGQAKKRAGCPRKMWGCRQDSQLLVCTLSTPHTPAKEDGDWLKTGDACVQ